MVLLMTCAEKLPETQVPQQAGLFRRMIVEGSSLPRKERSTPYLCLFGGIMLLVWGPISLLLTLKPDTYTSQWTLILPGTGNGLAVNLDSIGQATANAASPYTNSSVDPVVNYKAISQSSSVLAKAAESLGMSPHEFGNPRIKLVDQTALMDFRISANTAVLAHRKAIALYNAFQHRLDQLRDDEAEQQTAASLAMLEQFNSKLEEAQQKKLSYPVPSTHLTLPTKRKVVVTDSAQH